MPAWSIPIQQGGWKLRVLSGTSIGKEFDLTPARYVLGSKPPASIVIPDPSIAPQHVVIDVSADRVEIRDCSGGAGVTVNGARVASAQLAPGDQVTTGRFTFTFSNPNWRPPTAPASPYGPPAAQRGSVFDRFVKLPLWVRAGAITFVVAAVLFVLLSISHEATLVPVTLLAMSAVVPATVMCWVVEKYDRTGISFHTLALTFLAGGTIGVGGAMVVYLLTGISLAALAGLAEEPGKLLATSWRWRHPAYDRPMDGLILGTVAGFGFAVVETAGYGLRALLQPQPGSRGLALEDLLLTMVVRGLSSPFCHGLWSGIFAAGFWQVGRNIRQAIRSKVFWVAAAWAVGLHALWNGSAMLTESDPDGKSDRLGCIALLFTCFGYVMMIVTAVLSAWQYRRLLLNNGYRR